jgi:endonuclease/exonuclease/phosphatase family metal-dependent hydrolase
VTGQPARSLPVGSLLRVGSFNLLSGRSPADGVIEPERLAETARQLDADVLAVQEVDLL